MTEPLMNHEPVALAGRSDEQAVLDAALARVAAGHQSTVLLGGEAGVGKTLLARTLGDSATNAGFTVVWCTCVRLTSELAPLLALIAGLEAWAGTMSRQVVSELLTEVPSAGFLLGREDSPQVGTDVVPPLTIDRLLSASARRQPTVLVVDDVQYADEASRDVLSYVITGIRGRRLLVVASYRDEDLVEGHHLHGWLADVRRLPGVTDLAVQRLTEEGTEEQLSLILGAAPSPRLVRQVQQKTQGNPYFTDLLAQSLGPGSDSEDLPPHVPVALRAALMAAWHRRGQHARDALRVLAVAARPSRATDVAAAAAVLGLGRGEAVEALAEATESGLLRREDSERIWFRHPLLAEVLHDALPPGIAPAVHLAWARQLEERPASGAAEVLRQGDLARHYEVVGDSALAFRASLSAATHAEAEHAPAEASLHLERALRLWPQVAPDVSEATTEIDLLQRLARQQHWAGDSEASLQTWRRALAEVDDVREPGLAARLLVASSVAAWAHGEGAEKPIEPLRRAVALTSSDGESDAQAHSLAQLALGLAWNGELEEARGVAHRAVAVAERCGSVVTRGCAWEAASFAGLDPTEGGASAEAMRLALEARDPERITVACTMRCNWLVTRGRRAEALIVAQQGIDAVRRVGLVADSRFLLGMRASYLLQDGRLPEASEALREALTLPGTANSGAHARLRSAVAAVRTARPEVADMHIERARELVPSLETRPGLEAPPYLAECLVAGGRNTEALEMLARTMPAHAVDPQVSDLMLMWAARSAADLAELGRARKDQALIAHAHRAYGEVMNTRRQSGPAPFLVVHLEDRFLPAIQALHDAELQRLLDQSSSEHWQLARLRCEEASLGWDCAVAGRRLAETLIAESAPAAEIVVALRRAHRFAREVGGVALEQQLDALAAAAGVALAEMPAPPAAGLSPFGGLTPREEQVLAELVTGRTYAQIASDLFISEKTVSVHVSSLLRKTGTSSRRDLAALAIRLGMPLTN